MSGSPGVGHNVRPQPKTEICVAVNWYGDKFSTKLSGTKTLLLLLVLTKQLQFSMLKHGETTRYKYTNH